MQFDRFVLAASTADLGDEPRAREGADAVEYRMDLADGDPVAALDAYDGDLPVIATNRASWEGGEAGDDAARLDALAAAAELPAVGAVDVELASLTGDGARVADRARARGTAVVASVHDFDGTPPRAELRASLRAAARHGDVGKLAVTADSPGDALDLLAVTHELADAGATVATMAMGEAGRHTRAVAPVYGSQLGYAPVDPVEATAPGQYDLATLASLVETLGVERA